MRIFKLDILGLKRRDNFDINSVSGFFGSSPATLIAKKKYFDSKRIDYKKNKTYLTRSWSNVMKLSGEILDEKEAKILGRRITTPIKAKYDKWMNLYKNQAKMFYEHRNRRIIDSI